MILPLLASILALGLGPLIYSRFRGAWAATAIDAFALVGVGGLVFVHILPQVFTQAGWIVFPAALVGFFGPGFLCGSKLFAGQQTRRIVTPLAVFGIIVHALLDGLALTHQASHEETRALSAAVIVHRIPIGLGLWWLAAPLYGRRAALGLLSAIALFSALGFFFGEALIEGASSTGVALFQALIAGSLIHVIFRHPPVRPEALVGPARYASGLGGLAGLGLVLFLESLGHEGAEASGHAESALAGSVGFQNLALQSAPALLVAYLAIAFVHALNINLPRLLGRGGKLSQTLRGTAAGLPVPICSCGVIPLYRSLVVSGVPTPAAMSFLVATPEVGIPALALSWHLLGTEITLVRALCAAVLAITVGLLVGSRAPNKSGPQNLAANQNPTDQPFPKRLKKGLAYSFGDMVDGTAPWILAGLLLAGTLGGVLDLEGLTALPYGLDVPLFALIGLPLYVCASGSTPLAAVLIAAGVSPGAGIAFLLTGPATNLTTFGVLAQLHSRKTATAFAATAIGFTLILGWTTNALLPSEAVTHVEERLHAGHFGALEGISGVLLGLIFIASLLRQGTRAFLGQVIAPHSHAGHDHDHDGCHDDGHGHSHGAHVHEHHTHAQPPTAAGGSCCGTANLGLPEEESAKLH